METFEGFSLEQTDAFANISLLIEAGMLLAASTNGKTEEVGDIVLDVAKKYSRIASQRHVYVNTTQPTPTPLQPSDTLTIGARIRQLRKERMLTQAELAKSVDVQPNLVTMWENSTTEPRAKHIIPLANALQCDPVWLLSGNPLDVKAVSPATPAPVNVMKGADLANIGVRIESRRNELGMSHLRLAEKIDTSGAMILEWETGKAIPHSGYYDRLAKALNTTVTWLMTGKDINADSNKFQ
ncbi:helix-turn-helix domain-containing protein [Salmonella enterica]|nr:helix-turn-helix domain-containing protein [Salmonella enterica]ELQ8809648.1 helix-turn-helix domain-containing protein [Salmonella enterica]